MFVFIFLLVALRFIIIMTREINQHYHSQYSTVYCVGFVSKIIIVFGIPYCRSGLILRYTYVFFS